MNDFYFKQKIIQITWDSKKGKESGGGGLVSNMLTLLELSEQDFACLVFIG